jgi:hypothetical protein
MISSYICYVSLDNVKVIEIFYLCNFVQYNEEDKSKVVKKKIIHYFQTHTNSFGITYDPSYLFYMFV